MISAVLLLWLIHYANCAVNIASNNEAWYCNSNPLNLHPISPLSSSDLSRIKKLKQVHVMTRHGARTSYFDVQRYFPSLKQYYKCNISTITSRILNINNDYKYFIPMLKKYEDDNQILLHSNCQWMQSLEMLINQHQQNAQLLTNAYMKSNNTSYLFDITDIINNASLIKPNMKFYTSNFERCMLSTMVLVTQLLNLTSSELSTITPIIETITNDNEFNPYSSLNNKICTDNEQYKTWLNRFNHDIFDNFITPKQNKMWQDTNSTLMDYLKEGGGLLKNKKWNFTQLDHPGFAMAMFYCNGFDIPLSNKTFWAMIEAGLEYINVEPDINSDNETERQYAEKKKCFNHFISIPMYKRFFDDIHQLIDADLSNSTYPKFILHSAHDSSISMLLSGLGLFDGIVPYFAQMVTLEIYLANTAGTKYLFRFTNKGKFVPYAPCMFEYDNFQTELCGLNILLNNAFKDVNITQREWANNSCATLIDDKVCSFHNITINNDTQLMTNNDGNEDWIFDVISFIVGITIGIVMTVLIMLIIKQCKKSNKSKKPKSRNYQEVDDDIEIRAISESEMVHGSNNAHESVSAALNK